KRALTGVGERRSSKPALWPAARRLNIAAPCWIDLSRFERTCYRETMQGTSGGPNGGSGSLDNRSCARESAVGWFATSCRCSVYARATLRWLRSQFGRLGGAVADPRLAPTAIDVHDGIPVVEYRHHGWSALRGTDWRPVRSSAAIARQFDDLRGRFAAQGCRGVAQHAEPLAVFHWDRHRRWLFRCGRADRRLHPAPPARDDDYGYVYRRAPGRLPRWADRSVAA